MYHRILPHKEAARLSVEPGMYVTPETFARQLGWLAASFRVLRLSEAIGRLIEGSALPKGACVITFDDGWRDNFVYALPALQKFNLSASVFLVASRVGTEGGFWPDEVCRILSKLSRTEQTEVVGQFNPKFRGEPTQALLSHFKELKQEPRDRALEKLRAAQQGTPAPIERELMNWQEVEQMADSGIEFESHGLSHSILTGIELDEAEVELRDSRAALLERGYAQAGVFAYPTGAYNSELQKLVLAAGYRAALTTQSGLAAHGTPPTTFPRIGLHDDISASRAEFHRQLPGWAGR
jgi:peptidoglycan/xylan/chitin deacetylase (PgdA/CDA1 family)